jgi:hypothetical protein
MSKHMPIAEIARRLDLPFAATTIITGSIVQVLSVGPSTRTLNLPSTYWRDLVRCGP